MGKTQGDYEQQQLVKIEEWENASPSHISRAVGFFAAPLVWAATQVVPESAMEQALNAAFVAASAVTGGDDLLKDARLMGYSAERIADLSKASLHLCDALAVSVTTWAKGLAGTEGAITGVTGLPGLAVDIPAMIVLAIRTIRRMGFCYGFDTGLDDERSFILQVLSAGAANTSEEKTRAVKGAWDVRAYLDSDKKKSLAKAEGEILGKETFAAAVRNLAKQLCINLTRRKATQAIPVIGGGVAAVMNVWFINDVAEGAMRLYQKRRLEIITVDGSKVPAKKS